MSADKGTLALRLCVCVCVCVYFHVFSHIFLFCFIYKHEIRSSTISLAYATLVGIIVEIDKIASDCKLSSSKWALVKIDTSLEGGRFVCSAFSELQ